MAARNQVAIRLGVEGEESVRSSFNAIGDAGERAAERLGRKFVSESAAAEAAAEKAARTAARIAELANVTPTQQRIATVTGQDRQFGDNSAQRRADFAAAAAEADNYARKAEVLKGWLDPLWAAQNRFDAEMAEARTLFQAGAISAETYGQAQVRLTGELAAATRSHGDVTGATGLQRAGMQQLGFQMQDFAVQVGGGTSASRALAQQLPQATGAIAMMAKEGSSAAAFLTGPWGIAIAIGAAVLPALIGKLFETGESVASLTNKLKENAATARMQSIADANYAASVAGRIEALRKLADANKNVGQTEEQRRQATISQFGAGSADIQRTLDLVNRKNEVDEALRAASQKVMGGVLGRPDSQAAEEMQRLGRESQSLKDRLIGLGYSADQLSGGPLRALRDWLRESGWAASDAETAMRRYAASMQYAKDVASQFEAIDEALTPAGRENQRHRLTQTGITALGLPPGMAGVAYEPEARLHHATTEAGQHRGRHSGGGGRAAGQARAAESMEENARQTLLLADAYLQNGSAALIAEARRKAFTDATRAGTDREAQYRRQLALTVAEQIAGGAKAVLSMNEQTEALQSVVDHRETEAGGIEVSVHSYHNLNREIEQANALQPLLRLQALATGDAQAKLTAIIDAQREAFRKRNEALAAQAVLEQRSRLFEAEGERGARVALIGSGSRWQDQVAELQARQAALREALDKGIRDDPAAEDDEARLRRTNYVNRAVADAAGQLDEQRRTTLQGQIEDRTHSVAVLQAEYGMLGLNQRERERRLRTLQLEYDLNRQFGPEYEAQKQAILGLAAAEEERKAALERAQASMAELHKIGDRLIDDVLNPQNWSNWGDAGKKILNDLMADLLRLSAINPLKNWLLGEDNPTLGGILGGHGGGKSGGGGLLGFLQGILHIGAQVAGAGKPGLGGAVGTFAAKVPFIDPLFSPGNFAPGNATGTAYFPGGWAMMNEMGKEIVKLPRGSEIIPAGETRRRMGANDNGVTVHITNNNDFSGADPRTQAAIEARLDRMESESSARAVAAVREAISRNLFR